jgi:hypothetical protein
VDGRAICEDPDDDVRGVLDGAREALLGVGGETTCTDADDDDPDDPDDGDADVEDVDEDIAAEGIGCLVTDEMETDGVRPLDETVGGGAMLVCLAIADTEEERVGRIDVDDDDTGGMLGGP